MQATCPSQFLSLSFPFLFLNQVFFRRWPPLLLVIILQSFPFLLAPTVLAFRAYLFLAGQVNVDVVFLLAMPFPSRLPRVLSTGLPSQLLILSVLPPTISSMPLTSPWQVARLPASRPGRAWASRHHLAATRVDHVAGGRDAGGP